MCATIEKLRMNWGSKTMNRGPSEWRAHHQPGDGRRCGRGGSRDGPTRAGSADHGGEGSSPGAFAAGPESPVRPPSHGDGARSRVRSKGFSPRMDYSGPVNVREAQQGLGRCGGTETNVLG